MNILKKYINPKNLILLCITFTLFYTSVYLRLIPIKLFNLDYNKIPIRIILSLFSDIILLLVLILIYRKELIIEFKKFKNNFIENIDTGIKCWLIGLFVMMVSNIILNIVFKAGGANNEKSVQQMIKSLPWLMIILVGFIGPIIEELVFRKGFRKAFKNKYLFIILSGTIFGAMHIISSNDPLQILYLIPYSSLGIAFAISYEKTDTIFTPITLHILHNTILTTLSIIAL